LFSVFFGSTPAIPCSSAPGPFQPGIHWWYKITYYYINPIVKELTIFIISLAFILFLLGIFQKGTPRIIGIIIIMILTIWVILSPLLQRDILKPVAQDGQRVSSLMNVMINLESYYIENKRYPGNPGSNQFHILGEALKDFELPNDPCYKENPNWTYEYWVSSDGQKYVLKANLQNHLSSLEGGVDLDGNILGASCGENGPQEREYCLSSISLY